MAATLDHDVLAPGSPGPTAGPDGSSGPAGAADPDAVLSGPLPPSLVPAVVQGAPGTLGDDLAGAVGPVRAGEFSRRLSAGRVQLLVIGALIVGFAAAAPFSAVQFHKVASFLPAQLATVVVLSALTSLLLLQRFLMNGSIRMAGLGLVYVFSALAFLTYALAFSGVVVTAAPLGASASLPVWIWIAGHVGFPVLMMLALGPRYRRLSERAHSSGTTRRRILVVGTLAVVALAGAVAAAGTYVVPHLPAMVSGVRYLAATRTVLVGVLVVNLVAAALVWRWTNQATAIERWAALAVMASVVDAGFAALSTDRYSLAWYLSRSVDVVVGGIVLVALMFQVGRLYRRLLVRHLALMARASHDALTGVLSRAAILAEVERTVAVATGRDGAGRRQADAADPADDPLSVAMMDLDHFKQVNDRNGHVVGDEVLAEAAQRARSALRQQDRIGRYGGEEFLLLLPGCTGPAGLEVAERVRRAVADGLIPTSGGELSVTVSVGVAEAVGTPTVAELVALADSALYRAKRAGRNRTRLADPAPQLG